MIDKKEAKSAYKLSKKVGAVVAYKNLETNERYIDIAPDLAGVKNRFVHHQRAGRHAPTVAFVDPQRQQ